MDRCVLIITKIPGNQSIMCIYVCGASLSYSVVCIICDNAIWISFVVELMTFTFLYFHFTDRSDNLLVINDTYHISQYTKINYCAKFTVGMRLFCYMMLHLFKCFNP